MTGRQAGTSARGADSRLGADTRRNDVPAPTPASAGERSFPRCQDVMAADVTLWVPSSLAGKQETHRLRAWLATPSEPVWTSEALHGGPSPGGTQGHQGSVTS